MKRPASNIGITKASGIKVPFNKGKLKASLLRSGADPAKADEIVSEIMDTIVEGMSTKKIYKAAYRLLRNISRPVAARYKLKQAIMELGPTGFPFELFIAEILKNKGYSVKVGEIVRGHCVNHEVDVIAAKGEQYFLIECKFHNRPGYICDVKIPLYVQSRFLDVEGQWKQLDGHSGTLHQAWVINNTRFSADALQYAGCMNMNLTGWDHPKNNGLKDWIDGSGLHPVTCLTTLTTKEKQALLERKIVLCKMICRDHSLLESIGVKPPRLKKVLDECYALCAYYTKQGMELTDRSGRYSHGH